MKREQLLKHWTVIEAFRNGKQVQVRHPPGTARLAAEPNWTDTQSPWFELDLEYRIKPEKKVGWLNIYPDGTAPRSHLFFSKELAERSPSRIACIRVEYEEGEGLNY